MSMLGWWMVHTTVLPVFATFFTARITMAAALASKPDVGSSMNMIEGLETSSTAMVSRFLCSFDRPLTPGIPTKLFLIPSSSTNVSTSLTNSCTDSIITVAEVFRMILQPEMLLELISNIG